MRGYLKIFVLRELVRKERTGYELMKSFEDFTGTKKPSPGTIYPLLNDLMKKHMVTFSAKDNKKIYKITRKGEKILQSLMAEKKSVFENIIKMLGNVYNQKEMDLIRARIKMIFSVLSGEKHNLAKEFGVLHELRESVFNFVKSSSYPKKRDEFRAIITNASKKIKDLSQKNEKHN